MSLTRCENCGIPARTGKLVRAIQPERKLRSLRVAADFNRRVIGARLVDGNAVEKYRMGSVEHLHVRAAACRSTDRHVAGIGRPRCLVVLAVLEVRAGVLQEDGTVLQVEVRRILYGRQGCHLGRGFLEWGRVREGRIRLSRCRRLVFSPGVMRGSELCSRHECKRRGECERAQLPSGYWRFDMRCSVHGSSDQGNVRRTQMARSIACDQVRLC